MKERSKERYATLLFEELIEHLSRREKIKTMLGEMVSIPVDELMTMLLDDFEGVLKRRIDELGIDDNDDQQATQLRVLSTDQKRVEQATAEPVVDARQTPGRSKSEEKSSPSTANTILDRLNKKLDEQDDFHDEEGDRKPIGQATTRGESIDVKARQRHPKIPYSLSESDHVYLHAVCRIPEGEEPSPHPFMLEEKGIDQQTFAFAFDYHGLRLYMSTFLPAQMAISKTGVLLLGKQEGLQLRGVHQNILNELRIHGAILPFEFATIGLSRNEILHRLDRSWDAIEKAADEIAATEWLTLDLLVLDARIAQLFADKSAASGRSRERERVSHGRLPPAKTIDIKSLEKILQKEKKIAENVHKTLDNIADRSDIDKMIGLTSGTSEDWKLILKASYEVPPSRFDQFNRAVIELQYDHMLFDLMFQIEGKRESFALPKS